MAEINNKNNNLKVILPKETRLEPVLRRIREKSGFEIRREKQRQDYAVIQDRDIGSFEALFLKAERGLSKLRDGGAEIVITGRDRVNEFNNSAFNRTRREPLRIAGIFNLACCRLSLAAPRERVITTPQHLSGLRLATSYPATAERWLRQNEVRDVEVVFIDSSVELAVREDEADCVLDMIETGTSLADNDLQEKIKIFDSSAVIAMRADPLPRPRQLLADAVIGRLLSRNRP